MNDKIFWTIIGVIIPFIGTTSGSAVVFFFKNSASKRLQKIFNGFAAGVMLAASIWSLIIPAIEMEKNNGGIGWLPATIGIILGVSILLWIDDFADKMMDKNNFVSKTKRSKMLNLAITLHNIPEGMAVRNSFCIKPFWKLWNSNYSSFCISYGNCNSKFSRRNGNFTSIQI